MEAQTTVLVVDDDEDIRDMLSDYLGGQGYRVLLAENGEAMREVLMSETPAAVLLDIGLPGEDGLSLARFVREQFDIAIIMVSGAGETVDRIIGLEVGADDYLSKPFDLRELRARVKSVIRRYQRSANAGPSIDETPNERIAFGIGLLDTQSCQLFDKSGEEIPVTALEYELLKVFVERPNRPLSRDQLMSLTRNRDWDPYDRSIDIRIARLRKKIEADPEKPQTIKTMRGVGYMYVPSKTASV